MKEEVPAKRCASTPLPTLVACSHHLPSVRGSQNEVADPTEKNIYISFFPPFSFVFSQINRLIAHLVEQYIFKSAGINSETESTDK